MPLNVHIVKNGNETSINTIRRFTRKVQESGVLRYAKSLNYYARPLSGALKKKRRLKAIAKKAEKHRLYKLGKI
jgi:ribosomal protein S21